MTDDSKKTSEPALEAYKTYEHFCKAMLDGFVVVNASGKIVKSNPIIAQMSGLTTKQILALSSFDDLFSLNLGGKLLNIQEILTHKSPTRFDEVASHGLNSRESRELNLIIGYYPFYHNEQFVGAWLLLRDVTAETQLQDKYKDKATKSITDPMTGLFNRGHFEEYMKNQEKSLVQLPVGSDHRNLSVIMGDIDHFKKINDKYGHPTGDYVIKIVSQIISKAVRKTDVVCRYGGEEFLIILPASNLEGAAIAAEKIRSSIENYSFEFEGSKIPVLMSFGVAQLSVGNEDGKAAIARADAALYGSKHNGRNRVSLHADGVVSPSTFKLQTLARAS
ncbi:MAG: diguanylate cyclase [Proteobacteria bacterium]|nr:diguanylate cyclase [Pseudomonadota bacterium]